jgi:uncharacterized protein (DUF58 family)
MKNQYQQRQNIQGVNVDVEDLVKIQQRLSGFSLRNFHKLTSKGNQGARSRGHGMDYEESRAYVVGDDARAMDWQVMARTGEAHSKVFAEERERAFLLAVDLSSSMFFGTQFGFKSWAAAQVAAHIGWLANGSGERLGGMVASIDALHQVRPVKTRSGLMSLLSYLAQSCDRDLPIQVEASQLNAMLTSLRQVKAGSTLILISDFLGIDENTSGLLQSLSGQHDLSAIWIHDVSETDDWLPGPYPVKSDDPAFILDTRHSNAAGLLLKRQQTHQNNVESLMARFNIGLCGISCNRDITEQLKGNFKRAF